MANPRDIPAEPDTAVEHEMRTKTIPEDGNYVVTKMAENGAPVIEVNGTEYEVTLPGHVLARTGNFLSIRFEKGVATADRVL